MTNTLQRYAWRTRLATPVLCLTASAIVLVCATAGRAAAQQPTPPRPAPRAQTPRRQETIEIRGQVPTPQVVTVRPREAPAYSRKVLVPAFFDRDFWPSILPPLQIVSAPGGPRADSVARVTPDSASRAQPGARPPLGTPPASLRP
jgi:hypothetical protein